MATKKRSSGGRKPSAKRTKAGKSGAGKRAVRSSRQLEETSFFRSELFVIGSFVLSILLFFSNFGLGGKVGRFFSGIQLGLFGYIGYFFPFLLFGIVFLHASDMERQKARMKSLALFLLLIFSAAIIHILLGERYNNGSSLLEFYKKGGGGGMIGGAIASFLLNFAGVFFSLFLCFALVFLCLVFITQRSFVGMVKKNGGNVYRQAKVDLERRRESRQVRRLEKEAEREKDRHARSAAARSREGFSHENSLRKGVSHENPFYEGSPYQGGSYENISHERVAGNNAYAADPFARQHDPADDFLKPYEPVKETNPELFLDDSDTLLDIGLSKMKHSLSLRSDSEKDDSAAKVSPSYIPPSQGGFSTPEESLIFPTTKVAAARERLSVSSGTEDIPVSKPEQKSEPGFESESEETLDSEILMRASKILSKKTSPVFGRSEATSPRHHAFEEVATSPPQPSFEKEEENRHLKTDEASGDDSWTEKFEEKNETTGKHSGIRIEMEQEKEALFGGNDAKVYEEKKSDVGGAFTVQPKKAAYVFPLTSLLKSGMGRENRSQKEYQETALKLQQTLHDFGVEVKVTNISRGPVVTRYELQPNQGVKVSKIVALTDDIKLSLAASDIRIEAPIPGKAAVGIEVPNKENMTVYLRDLLESREFREEGNTLSFAVGMDIAGKAVVSDVAKMPHMLIAGATGSGKSVCINTLILSILYKYSPDEVKLIMIDPKVVELSIYNGIPHLLVPVVTEPKKAAGAIQWGVTEMTERYKKFAEAGVRNLKGYNDKIRRAALRGEAEGLPALLPQIVIIIDELADLMMVAQNEVEEAICRLAQLARACGIHLVIATQRPSVNVITGLIKANIPSRIAFAVSSGVDSRTILDGVGAERLLGKGDMLFSPQGLPKPIRVQGAFVSDGEVQAVVDFIASQGIVAAFDEKAVETIAGRSEQDVSHKEAPEDGRDELFLQAGRFIIEKEKASIGNLQRVFKIGFNRAARIMDQLSEAGVVGEEQGTKPRQILMSLSEFEEQFG